MSIDKALREHFGSGQAAAPMSARLQNPSSNAPTMPAADAPETVADSQSERSSVSLPGDTFEITYCDSRDQLSVRRISARRLDRIGDAYVLKAYCFERDAMRSFRLDRITSAVDLGTGEVFGDHQDLLEEVLWEQEQIEEAGFGDLVHEIRMLTYLAQCDGQFAISEVEVILKFLDGAGFRGVREETGKRIQRLVPDDQAFEESLFVMSDWQEERQIRFALAALDVITADGRITFEESLGLQAIRDALEILGVELPTGIG